MFDICEWWMREARKKWDDLKEGGSFLWEGRGLNAGARESFERKCERTEGSENFRERDFGGKGR
jgi:hypothetical protein